MPNTPLVIRSLIYMKDVLLSPSQTSLMEEFSCVRLARLTTLCGWDPVMNLLALTKCAQIGWGRHIGDVLPYISYNFKTRAISDIIAKPAPNCLKVGGEVVLDVPGCELVPFNLTFYVFI